MYSHITLLPIPKNGEVIGKEQFKSSCHITEVLNIGQGQPMRVAKGGRCPWFYHKVAAAKVTLVLRTVKAVGGKGKERRTAKVEGKGYESIGGGGHWRRMGRSEDFQWSTVAPVPILDLLVFQWLVLLPRVWEQQPVYRKQAGCASRSLTRLGRRRKLALSAAEKVWAFLGCVSAATHFFPPLCPSLGTRPSPPQPQPHGHLGDIMVPRRAAGSLEAVEAILWLNPWGQTPTQCYPPLHPEGTQKMLNEHRWTSFNGR